MSNPPETELEIAQCHMHEGEKRIATMPLLTDEMDKDNHPKATALTESVQDTMHTSLEIWRLHLIRIESRMKRQEAQLGLGM